MKKKIRHLDQMQFIAIGFGVVIIIGMFLLMLPISSRTGEWTGPIEALLTATSSSCVTGLIAFDTYTHWSIFGQIVIILLIQIGGLGFITIGVGFALAFQRNVGLRSRDLLKESVNAEDLGGVLKYMKSIIKATIMFEGLGALVLSIRFIPVFGFGRGIYYGVFHSISGFCNAGFDLMGCFGEYSSLTPFQSDPVVNITIMALIATGSLGFMVWSDLREKRFRWSKFTLHTKIVLVVTGVLICGGALLLFITERNASFAGLDAPTTALASFFQSVTMRTAGFNTVDFAAFTPAGKLVSVVLMFIGGSPCSTAGGIKTTAVAVLLIFVVNTLRGNSGYNIFKRRISDEVIKKASMVCLLHFFFMILGTIIVLGVTNFAMDDVLFETISALSTVGVTTGITRDLGVVGMLVMIVLMYMGRTGSMTFALSVMQRGNPQKIKYPEERITIG